MPAVEVLWWNVQRLFAPATSRIAAELSSTPSDGWTEAVYQRKLDNVAAVLRQALHGRRPGIIAFCEIEDRRVVADLLARLGRDDLIEAVGDDAHLEALDIVLLYARDVFEQVGTGRSYNVHNRFRTRDVFEVTLRARDGTELLVLANHWPSRVLANAQALRIGLADHTRRLIEAWLRVPWEEMTGPAGPALPALPLLEARWHRPALVIGDFNDEPFDDSIAHVLGATRRRDVATAAPNLPHGTDLPAIRRYLSLEPRLFNPSWAVLAADEGPGGTLVWDGDWYLLDQILCTTGMLGRGSIRYVDGSLRVLAPTTLETADGKPVRFLTEGGRPRPFSPEHDDGVSDHLPLACTIEVP